MALDPVVVTGLGLTAAAAILLGGLSLRHPSPGLPIAFYLFCLLEGVLLVFTFPWAVAAPLLPPLLVLVLAVTGGLALQWGRKEYVLGTIIALAATVAGLFAVYSPDLAVLLLLGGITVASALLCMESEEVMHSVYYLGSSFLGIAGIFLLLGSEFLLVVQILIYVGAVSILMVFGTMLTRRQIIEERPPAPPRQMPVRGRGLDWALKTAAVAIFLGALLYPLISPVWPVVPDQPNFPLPAGETPGPQSPTQAIADSLFGTYLPHLTLTALILLTALIGGAFLAKEDRPEVEKGPPRRSGISVPPLPPTVPRASLRRVPTPARATATTRAEGPAPAPLPAPAPRRVVHRPVRVAAPREDVVP